MLKLTICEFFKRLTMPIWRESYERTLQAIRWFLLISFTAVFIADLTECHHFTHYWQVVPDPGGACRQGYAQLITMGTANVVTDLLLVLFPIPIIMRSKLATKKKFQLVFLFAGSILPAGTTLFRIPNIFHQHGRQQYRSLLASIEILFATAVANGLVLGSFARDRGVKKQKWKFGSLNDSMEQRARRRGTATQPDWGSDEDLVRGLGLAAEPELPVRKDPHSPKIGPIAISGLPPIQEKAPLWRFPEPTSDDLTGDPEYAPKPPVGFSSHDKPSAAVSPPRKVTFFDVGGLLGGESPRRPSSVRTTDTDVEGSVHLDNSDGLSPAPPRRGSSALLQDMGDFLGPSSRTPKRAALETIEMQNIAGGNEAPDQITTAPPQL